MQVINCASWHGQLRRQAVARRDSMAANARNSPSKTSKKPPKQEKKPKKSAPAAGHFCRFDTCLRHIVGAAICGSCGHPLVVRCVETRVASARADDGIHYSGRENCVVIDQTLKREMANATLGDESVKPTACAAINVYAPLYAPPM